MHIEEVTKCWVRKQDHLIVKLETKSTINEMTIHTILDIHPTVGQKLSIAEFEGGLPN